MVTDRVRNSLAVAITFAGLSFGAGCNAHKKDGAPDPHQALVEMAKEPKKLEDIVRDPATWMGKDVAIAGTPKFIKDASTSTTTMVPTLISNGKDFITIYNSTTTTDYRYIYGLSIDEKNQIEVTTTHKFPDNTVKIFGKLEKNASGALFIKAVGYAVAREDVTSFR